MSAVRADVAAMLRAGSTQREIRAKLHVSARTVVQTRKALGLPANKRRPMSDDARRAATEQRHPDIARMLRAGASHRQTAAATGVSTATVTRVRQVLGIPRPERRTQIPATPTRTIAATLARYTEPAPDGHAHWTGSFNGTRPTLWHRQRPHQVRREAFRAHHGRDPQGRVRVDCDDPACIAGAHLTDERLRNADTLYDAIFGRPA